MSCYIDTNVFLNVVYKEPGLMEKSSSFLRKIHSGKLQGITSSVTVLELILDMAESDFSDFSEVAVASIEDLHNLEIVALDKTMTKLAADYVVKGERLTIHDAYHLATALSRKATVFVTRDADLARKVARHIEVATPEKVEDAKIL
mgnify:CR=1 FL=1